MMLGKWRVELVEGWQTAHKWFSTQAMAVAAAILGGWQVLPDDMKTALPQCLVAWVAVVLLVLGIGGRLIKQTPKKARKNVRK